MSDRNAAPDYWANWKWNDDKTEAWSNWTGRIRKVGPMNWEYSASNARIRNANLRFDSAGPIASSEVERHELHGYTASWMAAMVRCDVEYLRFAPDDLYTDAMLGFVANMQRLGAEVLVHDGDMGAAVALRFCSTSIEEMRSGGARRE